MIGDTASGEVSARVHIIKGRFAPPTDSQKLQPPHKRQFKFFARFSQRTQVFRVLCKYLHCTVIVSSLTQFNSSSTTTLM